MKRPRLAAAAVLFGLTLWACTPSGDGVSAQTGAPGTSGGNPATTSEPSTTTDAATTIPAAPSTTTTTVPTFSLRGRVTTPDGDPLHGATVRIGKTSTTTAENGRFSVAGAPAGTVTITRPAWLPAEVDWDGTGRVVVELEPRTIKGIRAGRGAAGNPEAFAELLDLAETTAVNTIVFDTKDESGHVLYETAVDRAYRYDAVQAFYDPVEALAQVKERGLYAITRIVVFEDDKWAYADSDAQLIDNWVDPLDKANWSYPLALAAEACALGFDEVMFDYVRFPDGVASTVAHDNRPLTGEERAAAVSAFLAEARRRLHPKGCAVSAAVFAIVFSSPTDQGIGQRPEEVSAQVDAISPMIYPSHYSAGWAGYDDPNEYPAEITAKALDDGSPRVNESTVIRPWLQAFFYTPNQVRAGIDEAEQRGYGWLLWNVNSNYDKEALPPA